MSFFSARRNARSMAVRGSCAALSVLAMVACLTGASAAEYKLQAGDTLEFVVIGLADLRSKATIDQDGEVIIPLIGPVRAAGMPMREFRELVVKRIAQKVLRQRAEDGRELQVVIDPGEVSIAVAEYRPVYVNGDVSKPGEQPFRSGLTVRKAVALAGGYDLQRFRANNPFLQTADLESEFKVLSAEAVKHQTRIARLEAELDPKAGTPQWSTAATAAPAQLVKDVQALEADQFKVRAVDRGKEKEFLNLLIRQSDAQLKVLNEQQSREEVGVKADTEDLQRLSSLFDKGNLTAPRMTEARRAVLLSSTRLLQTNVQIERISREREEIVRRLERLDDQLQLEVTRELQDARIQLANSRSRLEATGEKLLYTSTIRSQLLKGTGGKPDIVIVRKGDREVERIKAEEDNELLPGDVVEIALLAEFVPEGGANEKRPGISQKR